MTQLYRVRVLDRHGEEHQRVFRAPNPTYAERWARLDIDRGYSRVIAIEMASRSDRFWHLLWVALAWLCAPVTVCWLVSGGLGRALGLGD